MARVALAVLALLVPALPSLAGDPHIIAVDSSRALYEIDIATGARRNSGR